MGCINSKPKSLKPKTLNLAEDESTPSHTWKVQTLPRRSNARRYDARIKSVAKKPVVCYEDWDEKERIKRARSDRTIRPSAYLQEEAHALSEEEELDFIY